MRFIKKFIGLGILFACMSAQAANIQLVVELSSSATYKFLLADKPVVTFDKSNLVVNGDSETSFAISGVKNCHFEEAIETAAETVKADELRIIYVSRNAIRIENAAADAPIVMVSASGVTLETQAADAQGTATLELPQQKGVYIVMVGEQSFKVIRR